MTAEQARIVLDEIAWYADERAARAKTEAELRAALESIAKVARDPANRESRPDPRPVA